jgi:ABC-2 type transport system ATP-binding protein
VLIGAPYLAPTNKWRAWKLRVLCATRLRRARLRHPLAFRGVFPQLSTHGRSSDGEVVIETRHLAKRFGDRDALRGVSFDAHRGELLAVIGPNGAGKTTLLSILAGIRRQDGGTVNRPPGEIGWIPQQAALYRRLTVTENLRLFAHLEKVLDVDAAVEEMLDQTGLADRRDDQVGTLSGGNQQRINIAIGLLARPVVLLLDEPSAGLDPRQRERLWEFVLGLAGGGTTVIFSTHNIAEAERYGQRLLVLADGEALFDGTSTELHGAVHEPGARDFEQAFVAFLRDRGH